MLVLYVIMSYLGFLESIGILHFDTYLDANKLTTYNLMGLQDCARHCLKFSNTCLSFNFHRNTLSCELLTQTKAQITNLTLVKSGTIYSEISSWKPELANRCSDVTCAFGKQCIELKSGETVCIDTLTTSTSTSNVNVAFYVVLTHDQNPGVVLFDRVITNIGSGYKDSTGIFSASLNGVYVFSWSVETMSMLTNTTLEVNGIARGTTTADEKTSSYYDTSNSFAVLKLKAGDQVTVRVKSGRAVAGGTTFSGWRCNNSVEDENVAVYTSLSKREINKQPIPFDNVYTNTDNVYTPSTGYYKAKEPGLYIFVTSLSYYSGGMTDTYVHVKKAGSNSITKGYPITLNSFSGHYDCTATMTLAYLSAGDQVYIGRGSVDATSMFAGWLAASGSLSNYPAFSVSLLSDSSSSPLVFDKSHVNPNNGYSLSTGKFTAPKSGVYVFFWNLRADVGLVKSALNVNSVDIGETRSEGRSGANYDDSSSVAVVQLSAGDQVYVRMLSGTADEGQTAFCGWLLYDNLL